MSIIMCAAYTLFTTCANVFYTESYGFIHLVISVRIKHIHIKKPALTSLYVKHTGTVVAQQVFVQTLVSIVLMQLFPICKSLNKINSSYFGLILQLYLCK